MSTFTAKPMSFSVRAQADGPPCAEIMLYGDIGYKITAADFRRQLNALGEVSAIDLRVHSNGGQIFDGLAIYNTLKDHPAKVVVHVDGTAISMASVIAMAGDEIEMAEHSLMMIHNPLAGAYGEASDMRHMAALLDVCKNQLVAIYAERTKCDPKEISRLMDAETWLEPEEACRLGFADRTSSQPAIAAAFDPSRFTNVPENLKGLNAMSVNNEDTATPPPVEPPAEEPKQAEPQPPAEPPAEEPATEAASVVEPVASAPASVRTGKDFLDAFGQQGAVWFVEGKSWDEAQKAHANALKAENEELKAKLAAANFGQADAVSFTPADTDQAAQQQGALANRVGDKLARIAASLRSASARN